MSRSAKRPSPVNRTFRIPELLVAETEAAIDLATEIAVVETPITSMSKYVRRSCRLLGFASLHRFNPQETRLVVTNELITLPPLATTPREEVRPKKPIQVYFRLRELQAFEAAVSRAETSADERVCRALRFHNFLVEQGAFPKATFQRGAGADPITAFIFE